MRSNATREKKCCMRQATVSDSAVGPVSPVKRFPDRDGPN